MLDSVIALFDSMKFQKYVATDKKNLLLIILLIARFEYVTV